MADPEDAHERYRRLVHSESPSRSPQGSKQVDGKTPVHRRPAAGGGDNTLPKRVDEVDTGATRVTPAAVGSSTGPTVYRTIGGTTVNATREKTRRVSRRSGCFLRGLVISIFVMVGMGMLVAAAGIYEYFTISASLPTVGDLQERASQFETTRILDRDGNVLYEILDPQAGKRTYVKLDDISPLLVAATLATEDKDFYSHGGFDPLAILRAFWQNISSGETVSGASTITQQLAKALLLSPEERVQQSYLRKIREAILATEIERRYTKDQILELYLNEIFYGNLSYGAEAAAETYFNKPVNQLTLGEAAFLAGLPQTPSIYDIYSNRDATLARFQSVIMGMFTLSSERHCIAVSNSDQPVCVDGNAAADAIQEITNYTFQPPTDTIRYPHWVQYIRGLLEDKYDPQTIYRSGFTVFTTLDPDMQDAAQQSVTAQVNAIADKHVTDGALVAIQPSTGEILALVGSPDFYNDENAGQINMAVSATRQPGSSMKPFTYLAAFEKGWTPATLIWDVPSEFTPSGLPNDPNPVYIPTNFDLKYHGPVTVRTALANSYNVPAVKTLQFVGVYGDTGLIAMAQRLGINSLTRNDYGLSLTLGGGEVSLLDMTSAYAVIANGGLKIPPVAILKIVDYQGRTVFQYDEPAGERVLRPEHVFLMESILSDSSARVPTYGTHSVLSLPFQVAVKTGTSNDSRDNWTIGFTPDIAVGVWVGNADYTPMVNTTGVTGAGPIWAEFMTYAANKLTNGTPTSFIMPAGIEQHTICTISGTQPSSWCPTHREEYFASDQPPLSPDFDIWDDVQVDTWTDLKASPECDEYRKNRLVINVIDETARKWISQDSDGQRWARAMGFEDIFFVPDRSCTAKDPRPDLGFNGLVEGQTITDSPLDVSIVADATSGFRTWRLEWGVGSDPSNWMPMTGEVSSPVSSPAKVYTWDLVGFPEEQVTLRIYMQGNGKTFAEKRIHLNLLVPTPTPTQTPTPTNTPTPTSTNTPTQTPTTTFTETPTPT